MDRISFLINHFWTQPNNSYFCVGHWYNPTHEIGADYVVLFIQI